MRLIKLDASGSVIWAFTVGSALDEIHLASMTPDNGMLLTGAFGLLVRLDPNGNVLWARTHASSSPSSYAVGGDAIWLGQDRILHFLNIATTGDRDLGLVCTDDQGNLLHQNRLSGIGQTAAVDRIYARPLDAASAICFSDLYGASQAQLLVIDTACTPTWSAGPPGPLVLCGFKSRPYVDGNGHVWLAGGPSANYTSSVVYKIDVSVPPTGCWQSVTYSIVPDNITSAATSITITPLAVQALPITFPFISYTAQTGAGCFTTSLGAEPTNAKEHLDATHLPGSNEVLLSWPELMNGSVQWRIIDALGRTVGAGAGSGTSHRVPLNGPTNGLYHAEVRSGEVRLATSFFLLD